MVYCRLGIDLSVHVPVYTLACTYFYSLIVCAKCSKCCVNFNMNMNMNCCAVCRSVERTKEENTSIYALINKFCMKLRQQCEPVLLRQLCCVAELDVWHEANVTSN